MRAVVQRVSQAAVRVDGEVVGAVDSPGLLVLVGVTHTDTAESAAALAAKVWQLRILRGERSASDVGAPVLVVSQFTLYADTRKGRRPSWSGRRLVLSPRRSISSSALRCGRSVRTWRPASSAPACR